MVKAIFFTCCGDIHGFEIKGHSGFAAVGSDTVCAAVSSAAYMAANTITDVVKIPCKTQTDDGYMKLSLNPQDVGACAIILKGPELHIRALAKQYPKYIQVLYGGVRNA